MLSYFLWDGNAQLFSWGPFTLRWDGLLLIVAVVVARQLLVYIYKREGKPSKDVETLAIYFIIASFLGARLGYALFSEPQLLTRPLAVFFPFEFKPAFHFTGLTGFSSHGAVLGILVASWLYGRKKKPQQGALQVLDRISLPVIWIAVLVSLGSFLNSEIEGKPTDSNLGTIMVNSVTKGLLQLPCCVMRNPGGKSPLQKVVAMKGKEAVKPELGNRSLLIYFFFTHGTPDAIVDEFMVGDVKTYLYTMSRVVLEPGTEPLHYVIFKEPSGDTEVRVRTTGIARFPVQLFEAVTSLILFGFLFWYWTRHRLTLPPGRIVGLCLVIFWSLHFLFEFMKEDQSTFFDAIVLNRAQVWSVALIAIGALILIRSQRKVVSADR